MASDTDICNLALSHLGDEASVVTIDPPEGSPQADHCARFYPIARDSVLQMMAPSFATRRASMGLLTSPTAAWTYAYAKPSQCLRVLAVLPADATSDTVDALGTVPREYALESLDDGTEVILTNEPDAVIKYVVRVTDTAKFSPLVITTISHQLAAALAGPVLKGDAGRAEGKAQLQLAAAWMAKANVSDASQQKTSREFTPSSVQARR
jgi:hypothetical protein